MYPNLKFQLWKMGMRQNRLAKSLGMDETMLSKIMNGFREPSGEVREKIAVLLHSDVAWLFDRTTEPVGPDSPSSPGSANEGTRQDGKRAVEK